MVNERLRSLKMVNMFWDKNKITIQEESYTNSRDQEESYTNKYQKHVACSYCYKLVCVNDNFSKGFKSYLGEHAI